MSVLRESKINGDGMIDYLSIAESRGYSLFQEVFLSSNFDMTFSGAFDCCCDCS